MSLTKYIKSAVKAYYPIIIDCICYFYLRFAGSTFLCKGI